jgi:hypothetical protein
MTSLCARQAWGLIPSRGNVFLHLHITESGSEAHPASYPVPTVGGGQLRYEADHSPPHSANFKNGGARLSLPQTSSWCSNQLIRHEDNFTFCLSSQIKT